MEKNEQKKNTENTPKGKVLTGKVVSTKMKDTVVVSVSRFTKHPKYGKYSEVNKRYKAHDAGNKCKEGDTVKIVEVAPISRDKHFVVVQGAK